MASLELELYTDDPRKVAALRAYWTLAEDGGDLGTDRDRDPQGVRLHPAGNAGPRPGRREGPPARRVLPGVRGPAGGH
ncbi:hypothetical protein LT493_25980 [Streptomyces tricolor]|nr:hypothetical protein [Streptomyces tricolor]